MTEKSQRQAMNKEVIKESRRVLSERRVKQTKEGNEKIKIQYQFL